MNINRQEITKSAGIVGPALAIAGYILYSREQVWKWYIIALIVIGAAMLVASIVFNFRTIVSFFQGRQGKLSANTAVLSVAIIAIMGALNVVGYQYHKRFDLTSEGLYTLSDQTRKIVGALQKDVKVIKFSDKDDQQLSDRMAEFKYLSNRISYERVDPLQKPEVARQYAVQSMGETVIAVGDRIERPSQTDEQSLVNAIMKVTRDKLKRVCFTSGHGEKSISATEPSGYASVDGQLKNENYETKSINLATSTQVPAECDVLVVAGPKTSFPPEESAKIGKYLEEGGKAFLLLDPNTDPQLGDVLKAWNINLGNDTILCGPQGGATRLYPVVTEYGSHPITKAMSQTLYLEARSVRPADSSRSDINATEILKTRDDTWAETELKGEESKYDAGKDIQGPVSMGIAASKKLGDKEARLVVIGDSEFAANNPIRFNSNGSMFFNSVNWLAQDEDLISIRPKSATSRSLVMTAAQQTTFWWLAVLFMPLAAVGAGAY